MKLLKLNTGISVLIDHKEAHPEVTKRKGYTHFYVLTFFNDCGRDGTIEYLFKQTMLENNFDTWLKNCEKEERIEFETVLTNSDEGIYRQWADREMTRAAMARHYYS